MDSSRFPEGRRTGGPTQMSGIISLLEPQTKGSCSFMNLELKEVGRGGKDKKVLSTESKWKKMCLQSGPFLSPSK